MATILYTWKLGGGLGHVLPFRPVAERLSTLGHTVTAIARDPSIATKAFAGLNIEIVQPPIRTAKPVQQFAPIRTFAHLLHNTVTPSVDA